ncbi:MAG TPA: LacI family DNA-binding transcriptional regulator [Bacilli bacterium]|jgi:LacI family transcriptional regulator|nr:LacI family DNA-binding transcriptional regulator [Bacilli bacterium]HPZ27439.1 LacI family DNA-binding transcriptional regulator [Bacilli bacterium]
MSFRKKIRLIDIARACGYSVNTVSRALRDKEDIGKETREKIKKISAEMGYLPNTIASSLRCGSTHTIAIVFDNMINPYFMIMADKIHYRLDRHGYATMIFAVYDNKFRSAALAPIVSRQVDGIITFLEPEPETVEICRKNKIPLLLLGRQDSRLAIDAIYTNDYLGGYKVGKYLIDRGARNIGYLGAPETIECAVRRFNGLKAAIVEAGLPARDENFRFMTSPSFRDDLDILIKNGVDAIFFFNDVMALEGIKIIHEKGLKVPGDIKVIGYDGIESDFIIPNNITSVSSNKEEIVDRAVRIIMERINGETAAGAQAVEFPVDIKKGASA